MSKRRPGTDLNHDNWDREEEPEQPGQFVAAPTDKLSQRKIKVAKRRITGDSEDAPKGGLFGGFAGFGVPASAAKPPVIPISTASKLPSSMFSSKTIDPKPLTRAGLRDQGGHSSAKRGKADTGDSKNSSTNETLLAAAASASGENTDRLEKLRSLNDGILKCMKNHLEENPFIDLRPTFNSYSAHYANLFGKDAGSETIGVSADGTGIKGSVSNNAEDSKFKKYNGSTIPPTKPPPTFSFGTSANQPSSSSSAVSASTTTSLFSGQKTATAGGLFGLPIAQSATDKPAGGLFSGQHSGFSFGFAKQSSDSAVGNGGSNEAGGGAADDEDKPPVVELVEVPEEDSLYSHKCKLFFMKDGNFVEKGLGTLHLKEAAGEDGPAKKQLLIRAGTKLGNVLLNICLTDETPLERVGKNNVRLVCVANPPLNPKAKPEELAQPTTMLIRVKTGADADEVLGKMKDLIAGKKL